MPRLASIVGLALLLATAAPWARAAEPTPDSAAPIASEAKPGEPAASPPGTPSMAAPAVTSEPKSAEARSALPAGGLPRLYTNQDLLEQAAKPPLLKIGEPLEVFDYVLGALPAEVKVYPTENYYYFWFYHDHGKYAGNIRLDPQEREKGLVNFAYFEDYTEWATDNEVVHRLLGPAEGVKVEKIEPLVWRVAFRGHSVIFRLNDLGKVEPPPGFLRPTEVYLGPVNDDSGVRFYLVWNKDQKIFHYFLDEQAPPTDLYRSSRISPRVLIGKRTGFAFFRDRYKDRKILIGVFEANANVNNYYDGPFDQLPDNFIRDETLMNAILEVEPELRGKIDSHGNSPGGKERYLIGPYMMWRTEEDLALVPNCTKDKKVTGELYYACFVIERD